MGMHEKLREDVDAVGSAARAARDDGGDLGEVESAMTDALMGLSVLEATTGSEELQRLHIEGMALMRSLRELERLEKEDKYFDWCVLAIIIAPLAGLGLAGLVLWILSLVGG
ncbi:hypothetical protein LCGC14_1154350 [marine sediment metagenome]|uniref:Uncharacterized protein n=1 Tax=marine sediment metagenome TaxID=412755 RepID=A0A0F9LZG3_9ZZZZ